MLPAGDVIDVKSSKWKLMIFISISSGNNRLRDIERSIPGITSNVFAKELNYR
jgi:DNA-binding HxlR family transcriptional regulator